MNTHRYCCVVIVAVVKINFSIFGWWPLSMGDWVHGRRRMWTILTAGTRRFTCAHARLSTDYCVSGIYTRMYLLLYHSASHCLSLSLSISGSAIFHYKKGKRRAHTRARKTIRFSRVNMFSVFVPTAVIVIAQQWLWRCHSVGRFFSFLFRRWNIILVSRWTIEAHAIFAVAIAPFIYA